MPGQKIDTRAGDVATTYFHGRLSKGEMQTLREVAEAFGTTPAHAMRIILQRLRVTPPVIAMQGER